MREKIVNKARQISGPKLSRLVETAFGTVFDAGQAIKELYGNEHLVKYKGEIDLVTEADYRSEEILKGALSGLGDAEVMAEESATNLSLRDGLFWIVDPLDGTTNFAHGFPFFAPSVAYAQVKEGRYQTIIGCIYIPILEEFFWAIRGKGSFLNLKSIRVSREKGLSRALIATGFPYDVHQKPDEVIAALRAMIVKAQGIRRAGAAAIDLAYVACGRFDGFWEKKLKPWDTAAGILLVEESGGKVTDFKGGEYNPFLPEITASNGLIHDQMVKILRGFSCQHTNT